MGDDELLLADCRPAAWRHTGGDALGPEPVDAETALLRRSRGAVPDGYTAHDYLVGAVQPLGIHWFVWDRVIDEYAQTEAELLTVATVAYFSSQTERAVRATRRADALGSSLGARNLGVLLQERKDLDGAEAAYRRAEDRGDAAGALNLGVLVQERGDLAGAEAAYRRADEHGNASAAYNLGQLLRNRQDSDGAEAAYRRADERGHAIAAFVVGYLLDERPDRTTPPRFSTASVRGRYLIALHRFGRR